VPELPDLEYIRNTLSSPLAGRRIVEVKVKEPIVIRMLIPASFADALMGRTMSGIERRGPFLRYALDGVELIIHHMLSGRTQLAPRTEKPVAHLCFSAALDNGQRLAYGDDTRMGKVYVTSPGSYGGIPGYDTQGIDILSPAFTWEAFESLIKFRRQQARVFIMDQTAISAVGNAYADEILFAAGIHPKTPCGALSPEKKRALFDAVNSVISWGIREVEKAGRPTEDKVRGHMKVRNRKGEPCPVCGTVIRTTGVLGHDSFFCPRCQEADKAQKIPW
jgi:formamidopyrimidine-DNA glycosylase